MEKQRLSKVLAAAGVASRRACEKLIFNGHVSVNDKMELIPQTMVTFKDSIAVDGKLIKHSENKVTYILNKPKGYLCSSKKIEDTKIVLDLFRSVKVRLFTVGRLDKDTQGLIIVTNDGDFAQNVIHPSHNTEKEYLVKVQQEVTHEHLQAMSKGARIDGTFVKPVRVTKVRKGTFKIVVMEGKKREIRILAKDAGLKVMELTRIRIGGLKLGNLPLGTWREITSREQQAILE